MQKFQVILAVLKTHLISVICGVIALISVIISFWPTQGWYSLLQNKVSLRAAVDSRIEGPSTGLLTRKRHLPLLSVDDPNPADLKVFPRPDIIKEGDDATNRVQQESLSLLDAAVKLNQHDLLVPGSLPNPSTNLAYTFRDEYNRVKDTIIMSILNGGVPPTPKEVQDAKDQLRKDKYMPEVIPGPDGNPDPASLAQVMAEYDQEAAGVEDRMRQSVARKYNIYADNSLLIFDPTISGGHVPSADKIWNAQMGLWIQMDIAHGIANTNTDTSGARLNILEAPIKRLISLQFANPLYVINGAAGPTGTVDITTADPNAAVPKVPAVGLSGRVTNGLYDVVKFTLVIDVDANKIPQVIGGLTRNQLMTVNRVDIAAVDSAVEATKGFMYGSAPAVRLTLECEDLFLRKWTDAVMPDSVKKQVGAPTAGGALPGQLPGSSD